MFMLPRSKSMRTRDRAGHYSITMLSVCLLSCGLSAWAVGPDFVRPSGPNTLHYTSEGESEQTIDAAGATQRFEPGAKIVADWWRLFECDKLDKTVAQSIDNSPTLQGA